MIGYQQIVSTKYANACQFRNWSVADTAPHAEKRIAHRLELAGIEYFLLLREEFLQWSDRIKKILIPAFPSYIFVHVNKKEYYSAINQCGMATYVQFGGILAMVSENTLESIRKLIEQYSSPEICDCLLSPGNIYKIPLGPLKGIEGMVVRQKGKMYFYFEIKEWGKYIMMPLIHF